MGFIFFKEEIMKKIIFAIVVSLAVCSAFANESLTSVGVGIPIMHYKWNDVEENGNGVQFALKEHYIFDNGFSLVADLGLGNMKIKDYYSITWYNSSGGYMYSELQDGKAFYLNFDIGAGYALLNYQKFKLVLSALAGIGFQKYNKELTLDETTDKFVTFDAGLDLYCAFKFTQHFGAFVSCKGMYSIGKGKEKYELKSYISQTFEEKWKLNGFMITPSAGLVICF